MNLTSKKVIRSLLQKHEARPSKRFGQNFLISKSVLKKILEAANLQPTDIVLEIGPGIGNLTQEIAKRVEKVIAIEKDPKMIEILKETLNNLDNVEIVQGDILKIKIQNTKFKSQNKFKIQILKPYKIVANLPYYIVSPVIRKFLELSDSDPPATLPNFRRGPSPRSPKVIVLMVQKEVAQRICAKPPDMNLLAVSVQFAAIPEIISFVSKKSFWPQPKVDGVIIKITPKRILWKSDFPDLFFKIVKAGFSQPRKQLINNLSKGLKLEREKVKTWLLKNKIQPSQRAETLAIQSWIELTKNFYSMVK